MNISLIVPYFNEEKNIIYTLNQLSRQTYKPSEIIFVNSNSNDNSPSIVKNFINTNKINIYNFDTDIKSASEAKNLGIIKSKFEWLAFMDCDMSFQENWLDNQVKFALKYPEKKIIFGNTLLKGTNFIDKCCVINTYGLEKMNPTIPSSLVKKSLFDSSNSLFINSKSHYDSFWIKKNLNKEISIINKNSIITYLGTNYASNYLDVFKKSFYYSTSFKEVYPFKAYLSIAIFFFIIFCIYKYSFITSYLFFIYTFFKLLLIPLYKSKNINIFSKINFKFFTLFFTGFLLDLGRITGIVLSIILNNKLFSHYKNK